MIAFGFFCIWVAACIFAPEILIPSVILALLFVGFTLIWTGAKTVPAARREPTLTRGSK